MILEKVYICVSELSEHVFHALQYECIHSFEIDSLLMTPASHLLQS